MHGFIHILYLLTTVSTLTLTKIRHTDLSSIWNPTFRVLSNETSDSSFRHSLRDKYTTVLETEEAELVSKDVLVTDQSSEETTRATRRTTQRHHKRRRKTTTNTTSFTTKYESGTTKKQKRRKHHYKKGHTVPKQTSRNIKDHKQMEWHKASGWMEWHDPPVAVFNDTWNMRNKPGMLSPLPYLSIAENKFFYIDLKKWLSKLWSKVKLENIHVSSRKKQTPSFKSFKMKAPHDGQFWNTLKKGNAGSRSFQLPVIQHENRTKEEKKRSSSRPHKIKNNKDIKSFIKYIQNSTLIFFDNVTSRSEEYHWTKGIKRLAKLYKAKFKEFLKDTKDQKIKSDYGTHKVIINAIDVSNRIVTRLLNIMMSEFDKLGLLRYTHTAEFFRRELQMEKQRQLNSACSVLNICRSGSGIMQLLLDVLGVMLSLNDIKFKQAFDSITEATKNTNFSNALSETGEVGLKRTINRYESTSVPVQKIMIMLLKNIIDKRNTPLTVPIDIDSPDSRVGTTLALQEILNKIDEKVLNTFENLGIWNGIQTDMETWATRNTPNVQGIIEGLITHIKDVVENLDEESHNVIVQNVNTMVN